MSTYECVIGIITSLISIIGALFGSNGGVYGFTCFAFIYCVIALSGNLNTK